MATVSLTSLRRDDLAAHDHSEWSIREHPGVSLRLIDVSPLARSGPWESFSLTFSGPSGVQLGQGTLGLQHDHLGTLELFIVPLEPDSEGSRYECVFNQAASAAIATGG